MHLIVPLFLAFGGSAFAADGAALAAAAALPERAQSLRDKGLDNDQVKDALSAARESKLSAGDTAAMFEESAPLVEKHGPVDNFGAFVKEKLGEGLRGPELAASIKAAHEARGKGGGGAKPAPAAGDAPKPTPAPVNRPTPAPVPGKLVRPGTDRPAPGPRPAPGGTPRPAPQPGKLVRPGGGR